MRGEFLWIRWGSGSTLLQGTSVMMSDEATCTGLGRCNTFTASKVCHHSQLLPKQRYIHVVEVKYCEDTRPKNQLEASKLQHRDLCRDLLRASAQVTLHTILLGVGG
eukprot:208187-Pelagomonas_calceolata.AAC.1